MPISVSLDPRDSDHFFNMDDDDEDYEYNILDNEGGSGHNRDYANNDSKQNMKKVKKEEKGPFNALVSNIRTSKKSM